MRFKTLSIVTGTVCLSLAGLWLALPEWILTHWHVGYDYGDGLVSRRMACLFVGMGVILISLRNVASADVRRGVGNGVMATCLSLIGLGLYELISHHVGEGILYAIGLEALICLGFLTVSDPVPEEQPAPVR